MKTKMQTEFLVDKDSNTMTITREFAATHQQVWDCYTKSELLNKWWAPKPFITTTKSMAFKERGHWHYAMIDPDGQKYWGRMEYQTIKPIQYFEIRNGFSDESGEMNSSLPVSKWKLTFEDSNERAAVQIVVSYDSTKDLEQVIAMGMQQGLTSALDGLEELLLSMTKS